MWVRLLAWFATWALRRLERAALKYGSLTLQQTQLEQGHGWTVSLRAHQNGTSPRYCWTSDGESVPEAIRNVMKEAEANTIGAKPILPHAPKLGGKRFEDWE